MRSRHGRERLASNRLLSWVTALWLTVLSAGRALAHGGFSLEEERLNVGLVTLSFAMIAAFIYLATQGKSDRGRQV